MEFKKIIFVLLIFLCSTLIYGQEEPETDKTLFEQRCSLCHTINRPISKKKTPKEWQNTVERMRLKNNVCMTEAEAAKIVAYMNVNHGPTINKAKDPDNLTPLEEKHVPFIIVNWEDLQKGYISIKVEVGKTPHPMDPDHYIKNIELFVNFVSIAKVELTPKGKPVLEFKAKIAGGEHIKAQAECNKHGLWESGIR